jgi:hypothetical protein
MVLKQIITRNIQNHREVVIDLPPTGLIVFTGANSNGKSVIVKTTRSLLNGDLRKPRKRASLVNRNATFGEITYVRDDDMRLTCHIAREASMTYFKLEVPGEDAIVRYLADKSYSELMHTFGWHYDEQTGISLNIAEEEDALLFYKTSNKINASILETATTDSTADKVSEAFENTLKDARSFREQCIQQVRTYSSSLNELKVEPIAPLIEKSEKLSYYFRNLEGVYLPNLPEIHAVPVVHFANVYMPELPVIKAIPRVHYASIYSPSIPVIRYPKIMNISCHIPDIISVASELKALREHKCPTCGRGFDCACTNTISD